MPATYNRPKTIAAIRIVPGQVENQGQGVFTQLPADAAFTISNEHATKNTVKVRYQGSDYLVFREDIRANNIGPSMVPVSLVES